MWHGTQDATFPRNHPRFRSRCVAPHRTARKGRVDEPSAPAPRETRRSCGRLSVVTVACPFSPATTPTSGPFDFADPPGHLPGGATPLCSTQRRRSTGAWCSSFGVRARSTPRLTPQARRPGGTHARRTKSDRFGYHEALRPVNACKGRGWNGLWGRDSGATSAPARRGIHCTGNAAPEPRAKAAAPAHEPCKTRKAAPCPTPRTGRVCNGNGEAGIAASGHRRVCETGKRFGTVFLEGHRTSEGVPELRRPPWPRERGIRSSVGRSLTVRHIDLREMPF